jgi:transmembrane sensor
MRLIPVMNSKLLAKYLRGQCSPEEVQEVLSWFKSEDVNPQQEQDWHQFWQEAEAEKEKPGNTAQATRLLEKLNRALDQQESEFAPANGLQAKEKKMPPRTKGYDWFKVAAAVLIPLCFLGLYATDFFRGDSPAAHPIITVKAAPGVRRVIKLEDGSRITLNTGSQVSYQQHFPRDKREIKLMGEAFFEVAKDSQRPFIVRTGTLSTRALGTSFNINYQGKTQPILVALATGSVQIAQQSGRSDSPVTRLKPGQQLAYSRLDQKYTVSTYDSLEVLGWREGILYFKKASLNQVIQKLEAWYGVDIEVTGKVPARAAEWHYTGSYKNQRLDDVLAGIAFVKSFTYKKKANKIYLTFH